MLDDEAQMIRELFKVIATGSYNELIGYGLSFDFRFIIVKAMKYGITAKQFADMRLYDLMQAMAQVKFKFVFFPQRSLKLSDIADFYWSFPKPFTDLEMLKFWKQGRSDKVIEFANGQIIRILLLYSLFRSVTENLFVDTAFGGASSGHGPNSPNLESNTSNLTIPEAHAPKTWLAKCKNDLQEFLVPMDQAEFKCTIDGTVLKRPT